MNQDDFSQNSKPMASSLIAPCGMNCRLCRAYLREKNACPGCRADDGPKPKTRVMCKIKTCVLMAENKIKYCFDCHSFPCKNLKHLDDRYRTKYGMSMIDNLENIKRSGIGYFVRQEKEKWTCSKCGEVICVHKENCIFCGNLWR